MPRHADTNNNGCLTITEAVAALQDGGKHSGIAEYFLKEDAKSKAGLLNAFRRYDLDRDGVLDTRELEAAIYNYLKALPY